MTLRVWMWVAAIAALAVFLGGCDSHGDDRAELSSLLQTIDDCNDRSDGKAVVELFTGESIERYGELLRLGLDGTREEVQRMGLNNQLEIMRMRARGKRSELEKLTPREYVIFATSRGWYKAPEELQELTTSVRQIRFSPSGTSATGEPVWEDEPAGERVRFVKEDGRWKLDEVSADAAYDALLRREARDRGVSVDKLLEELLEEEIGKPVPKDIWEPMKAPVKFGP